MGLSITGPIKVACSKKGAVKFMRLRFTLYAPKLHVDYEERSSGGLWINLDHAGIFNVLRSTNTRAFSFLASIWKATVAAGNRTRGLGVSRAMP